MTVVLWRRCLTLCTIFILIEDEAVLLEVLINECQLMFLALLLSFIRHEGCIYIVNYFQKAEWSSVRNVTEMEYNEGT